MVEKFMDFQNQSPEVRDLLHELLGKEHWEEPPNAATGTNVRNRGSINPEVFTQLEIAALTDAGFADANAEEMIIRHSRISIDGVMPTSMSTTTHKKRQVQ